MKSLVIAIATVFLSSAAFSQHVIDRHFKKYSDQEAFTKINVSGKVFELAAHLEDESNEDEMAEFIEFVSTVSALHMIVGDELSDARSMYSKALSTVERDYEELMSIDDKDGNITFYIEERNGIVSEFVGVGTADDNFMVFSLTGDMDLKSLTKMGSKLQVDGLEKIKDIRDSNIEEIKLYPNPVEGDAEVNIELPENMKGADITVYDLNGRVILTHLSAERRLRVQVNKLSKGQYIFEIKKGNVAVKRKVTVL